MLGMFLPLVAFVSRAHSVSETGILTDLLVYSLIIPVIPYQLVALGYDGIGSRISWLLVAFVRPHPPSRTGTVNSSFVSAVVRGVGVVHSARSSLLRGLS